MSGMPGPFYRTPVRLADIIGSVVNILWGSQRIVLGTDWPAARADWRGGPLSPFLA
jgi:hypothetical protein